MTPFPALLRARFAAALAAAIAFALALGSCDRPAQPDEPTALIDPDDWPNFGRTPGEQHYSPLDQIDSGNVGDLQLAWYYDLPPENTATGPIEADGKLFITTGHGYIRAFEAATGELLWDVELSSAAEEVPDGWNSYRAQRLPVGWEAGAVSDLP